METPLLKFVALNIVPKIGKEHLLHRFSYAVPAGQSLKMIDIPKKSKTIPFDDELLRVPKSRGWALYLLILLLLSFSILGGMGMWVRSINDGTKEMFETVAKLRVTPGSGIVLKRYWTGFKPLDDLVTIFLPLVSGDKPTQLATLDFLVTLLPFIAIMTIEANRYTNEWGLITL